MLRVHAKRRPGACCLIGYCWEAGIFMGKIVFAITIESAKSMQSFPFPPLFGTLLCASKWESDQSGVVCCNLKKNTLHVISKYSMRMSEGLEVGPAEAKR